MSEVVHGLAGRTIPIRAQNVGTSFQVLYTAPANMTSRAIVISLCNKNGSARTFSIQHNDGTTVTAIASAEAIGANARVRVPLDGQILAEGDTLEISASHTLSVDATAIIMEFAN